MNRNERIEVVHGSGNVFQDFGDPNTDTEQLKCILDSRSIHILDGWKLSVRKVENLAGVKAHEFSRSSNVRVEPVRQIV